MPRAGHSSQSISRRGVLALGGAAAASLTPITAWARTLGSKDRTLSFYNIHTGEKLRAIYWSDGSYLQDARKEIEWILRDWRTGEVESMDPALFDVLHDLRAVMGSREPLHIISGYRSPATNSKLRGRSNGVAKKSLHMRGMAVDIALPGRDLAQLRDAAKSLKRGGVGYYPKPGFIHVDTGRVRSW